MPDIIPGTNPRVQYRGTDGAWHDLPVARVKLTYTHDAPIPPPRWPGYMSFSFTLDPRAVPRSPQKHICSVLTSRLHALFPGLTTAQIGRLARVVRRKQGRSAQKHICSVQGTRPIHCLRGAK